MAGFASIAGPTMSVLVMLITLMVLPAVGGLVSDIGRQRQSQSLEGLGNAISWLWLLMMIGFLVMILWLDILIPRP